MLGLDLTPEGVVTFLVFAWASGAALGVAFHVLALLLPGEPPRDG
jgi:hypothetical protein